ncbi:MAG: DMT family transporter [Siphonobacter sp.]
MKNSFIYAGILFAALWASASAAAKFGLRSVEPMVLFDIRFIGAGLLLLGYAFLIEKQPLPKGREWLQLFIFGLLNTAIYLTLFVFAMKEVAAGIGSMLTATNPLLISIMLALWTRKRIQVTAWVAIALGMTGIAIATYPLLLDSYATPRGLLYLGLSMVAYSAGTIYFSEVKWNLSRTSINGWQTLIAGIVCIPLAYGFHKEINVFDTRFWAAEAWLMIPVSVIAVQLWLWLLKTNAVKASLFLFLCPPFGFLYATFLLGESFTLYTLAGTILVLIGLWIGQKIPKAA